MEELVTFLKGDGEFIKLLLEASGLGIFLYLFYKGLKAQIDSLKAKFDDLKESYDSFREAQKDIISQYVKLNETLKSENDVLPEKYRKISQDTLIPKNEEIRMLRDMLAARDKRIETLVEERDRAYKEILPIIAASKGESKTAD